VDESVGCVQPYTDEVDPLLFGHLSILWCRAVSRGNSPPSRSGQGCKAGDIRPIGFASVFIVSSRRIQWTAVLRSTVHCQGMDRFIGDAA
jgi:hypothetical protein